MKLESFAARVKRLGGKSSNGLRQSKKVVRATKSNSGASPKRKSQNKSGKSKPANSGSLSGSIATAENSRKELSAMERKWRAEDDARVLIGAKEVLDNPTRIKEARKVAQEKADAATKAVQALTNI